MRRFNLQSTQTIYGIKEIIATYKNVPQWKVTKACHYMANNYKIQSVSIYDDNNNYVCYYSVKYNNFVYPNGLKTSAFK